ncbi:hypothetical protein AMTR_s00054p00161890 [Amborella trichopoda]|uniref:Uncharacterized protein n=1 Tax=Amborella trichopoda TaxID=13333 RepID=U5D7G4_AMBTC|nr:hypothetical protein AMTR_s00054p00161890 [Amborella trichopoda]
MMIRFEVQSPELMPKNFSWRSSNLCDNQEGREGFGTVFDNQEDREGFGGVRKVERVLRTSLAAGEKRGVGGRERASRREGYGFFFSTEES